MRDSGVVRITAHNNVTHNKLHSNAFNTSGVRHAEMQVLKLKI